MERIEVVDFYQTIEVAGMQVCVGGGGRVGLRLGGITVERRSRGNGSNGPVEGIGVLGRAGGCMASEAAITVLQTDPTHVRQCNGSKATCVCGSDSGDWVTLHSTVHRTACAPVAAAVATEPTGGSWIWSQHANEHLSSYCACPATQRCCRNMLRPVRSVTRGHLTIRLLTIPIAPPARSRRTARAT